MKKENNNAARLRIIALAGQAAQFFSSRGDMNRDISAE